MKIISITEIYGDRVMVRPLFYWGDVLYFAGQQPPAKTMITLNLPGLTRLTPEAILAWVTEHNPARKKPGALLSKRRQVDTLTEEMWRETVLADFLEAQNYQSALWQLHNHFSLAELGQFCEQWLPEARKRIGQVLAIPADRKAEQANRLKELHPFLDRVFGVANQAPYRTHHEQVDLTRELEEVEITAMRRGGFSPTRWIKMAETLETSELSLALLKEVADHLAEPDTDQAYIHQTLKEIGHSRKLKQITYGPEFWDRLKTSLRLEGTLEGQRVDITAAQEETVQLGWAVFEAQRIGRVVPGRAALVLREDPNKLSYIAGERKLKFQISRAGGRLERHGNTLTLESDRAGLQRALLEVELLDTLANVNPRQAIAQVESLGLPADHPIFQAAAAVPDDPRQARILADLLIELVVGVDADVARRLVRNQSRASRG
jgi:hypothetical protein